MVHRKRPRPELKARRRHRRKRNLQPRFIVVQRMARIIRDGYGSLLDAIVVRTPSGNRKLLAYERRICSFLLRSRARTGTAHIRPVAQRADLG